MDVDSSSETINILATIVRMVPVRANLIDLRSVSEQDWEA